MTSRLLPVFVLLLAGSIAGCARNYSGKYTSTLTTRQKCYVLADGRVVSANSPQGVFASPFIAAAYGKPAGRVVYKDMETRLILTLRQEKADIGGNLVVTDGGNLTEFVMRSGFVDEQGLMHLQLMAKVEATASASFAGFGLSGGSGERLINLNQVKWKRRTLAFKIADSISLFDGLISQASIAENILIFH